MSGFRGHQPIVQIHSPPKTPLEEKARELLLNKTIVGVELTGDQLLIQLDDGGQFAMNSEGGFNEVQ